ncbi:MAG: hypothetical protein RMH74_03150 [Candidatus Caldarchaeum sp.]|nr:hypothetical protein [Candidatus Caldarchaeum sp.]
MTEWRLHGLWVETDDYFNRSSFITLTLIALNTRRVVLWPCGRKPLHNPSSRHRPERFNPAGGCERQGSPSPRCWRELALSRIGVESRKTRRGCCERC